jgi:dynein heavy chain
LFLEGAGWNRGRYLEDSEPKVLFSSFPIMVVSAISTQKDERPGAAKPKVDFELMKKTHYYCPVYKYPKRNDKYLIFRCYLKADPGQGTQNPNRGMTAPMKWKLSGVSLLCTKE